MSLDSSHPFSFPFSFPLRPLVGTLSACFRAQTSKSACSCPCVWRDVCKYVSTRRCANNKIWKECLDAAKEVYTHGIWGGCADDQALKVQLDISNKYHHTTTTAIHGSQPTVQTAPEDESFKMNTDEVDLCEFCHGLVRGPTDITTLPCLQPHDANYRLLLSSSETCVLCHWLVLRFKTCEPFIYDLIHLPYTFDDYLMSISVLSTQSLPSGVAWIYLEASVLGNYSANTMWISWLTIITSQLNGKSLKCFFTTNEGR